MIYEFEGKTEKDAIDRAVAELGLEKDQFDVEIVDIQKGSLFKKGCVKIKVHVDGVPNNALENIKHKASDDTEPIEPLNDEVVAQVEKFIFNLIEKMGYNAEVKLSSTNRKQVLYSLVGEDSAYLIGKKGKTLDALQLLGNIYIAKLGYPSVRVVIDCENYRIRREESLVRLAYETADKVASSGRSILLEPMNPYERRLIHTTLSDVNYIETKSEGDGLFKQVRVINKRR